MEGVKVSAELAYEYSGGAIVAQGAGTLIIEGLHDDGGDLAVDVYPTI